MNPQRVMLVHYNQRQVDALTSALEGAGLDVEVCPDGQAALARVGEMRPDLIILEAMIPRKNGFEVCREIKARPDGRDIPVVITSDIHRGRRYRDDAMQVYGCQEFLERGFSPHELVAVVRRLLPGAFIEEPLGTPAPAPKAAPGQALAVEEAPDGSEGHPGEMAHAQFDEGEINSLLDTIFPSDDASDLAVRLRAHAPAAAPPVEGAPARSEPVPLTPVEEALGTLPEEPPSATEPPAPLVVPAPRAPEHFSFRGLNPGELDEVLDLTDLKTGEPPTSGPHARLLEAVEALDVAPLSPVAQAPAADMAQVAPQHAPPVEMPDERIEDLVESLRRREAAASPAAVALRARRRMTGAVLLGGLVLACVTPFAVKWMLGGPDRSEWIQTPAAPAVQEQASEPVPIDAAPAEVRKQPAVEPRPARPVPPRAFAASEPDATVSIIEVPQESAPDEARPAPRPAPAPVQEMTAAKPQPDAAAQPASEGDASAAEIDAPVELIAEAVPSLPAVAPEPPATRPGELLHISEVTQKPSRVSAPSPAYPLAAKSLRVWGDVSLQVLVLETGDVAEVKVLSSPSPALSDAAMKAVRGWHYSPATKDGVAVRTWINEQISFRLK